MGAGFDLIYRVGAFETVTVSSSFLPLMSHPASPGWKFEFEVMRFGFAGRFRKVHSQGLISKVGVQIVQNALEVCLLMVVLTVSSNVLNE